MKRKFIIHHSSFTRLQLPEATADGGQVIRKSRGFTLVELIVVVTVMATLLGFIVINLIGSQQKVSLDAAQEILLSDLRQQQLKSMVGDTQGRPAPDSYGIHFDSNLYVLFHGSAYSPADTANSAINLPDNMQFNNSGFDIIFSRISGEIPLSATVEIEDNTNGNRRRIYLNRYGVTDKVESL